MNMQTTYVLLPGFDGMGYLYQGLIQELGDACEFAIVSDLSPNNNSMTSMRIRIGGQTEVGQ